MSIPYLISHDIAGVDEGPFSTGFGKAVELKGRVEVVKPGEDGLFAEAMQASHSGDSSRAEQLLGWLPRKKGFVAGMDVYATAFVAAQEEV